MSQNDEAQLEDRDVPPSTESGKEVTMRTENTGQAKEPELDPEKVWSVKCEARELIFFELILLVFLLLSLTSFQCMEL